MDVVRYVVAWLVVVFLPPGLLWWVLVHPMIGFWRRVGPAVTFTAVGVITLACAGGLYLVRDTLLGPDLGFHLLPLMVGVTSIGGAVAIGLRRRKHLTFRILAGSPELDPSGTAGQLLTEGPYAVVRHPRYVEIVFGSIGYAAIGNYLGAYLVVAACIPVLHLIVVLEERELVERFGQAYLDYRERVPRYVPGRR